MVVLDATVVNIALPSAQADLGFTDGDRQWVITAYSLAFGSLLLLGGRLSDLWGRKRTFIIGLIGFAAASALGGAAPTLRRARRRPRAAGRVRRAARPDGARRADHHVHHPQGARPRVRRLRRHRRRRRRHRPAARRLPHRELRLALEPLHQRGHRASSPSSAPSSSCASPQRTGPRPKLDIPGTVLVSGGLFLLVFGFSNAETEGWDSPLTWGMLAASARAARRASCCGSGAPRTRCCRSRSCSTATAAPPTRRCSSPGPACSASSCSSPTTCRPRSGTRRSRPACRSCR